MRILLLFCIMVIGCGSSHYHWEKGKDLQYNYVSDSGEICVSIIGGDRDYYVNTGFPHYAKSFTTLEQAKKYVEHAICR